MCVVTFGPYRGPVDYDRYVILDGDAVKLSIPEDCCISLPPGMAWNWTFELTADAVSNSRHRMFT